MPVEFRLLSIIMAGGNTILQASSTSSTSQITTVSGAVPLILAWLVCTILVVAGVATKRAWLLWSGVVAVGIMTVVTPLVHYLYETLRLGAFEASIQDFLLLTSVAVLGGGIITFGMLRLGQRRVST